MLQWLDPTLILGYFSGMLVNFWNVQNLLSLSIFILIISFLVINVVEDLYQKFKTNREYDALVQERARKSSCQKIKPKKY